MDLRLGVICYLFEREREKERERNRKHNHNRVPTREKKNVRTRGLVHVRGL